MTLITFDKTLDELRPLYFHLLDNYLNPDIGSIL